MVENYDSQRAMELFQRFKDKGLYYEERYVQVPYKFILSEEYTMEEKIMYQVLRAFAGIDGDIFPSKATLAKKTGMGKTKVYYTLKSLEEKGGLIIIPRHWSDNNAQTSNQYVISQIDSETGLFKPYPQEYIDLWKQQAIIVDREEFKRTKQWLEMQNKKSNKDKDK